MSPPCRACGTEVSLTCADAGGQAEAALAAAKPQIAERPLRALDLPERIIVEQTRVVTPGRLIGIILQTMVFADR